MATTPVNLHSVETRIKLLLNAQLKNVLRDQGLTVSGVKTELQVRLLAHLNGLAAAENTSQIERIRNLVNGTPASSLGSNASSPSSPLPQPPPNYGMSPNHPPAGARIHFKESPFFSIIQPLSPPIACQVRESTKDLVNFPISLSEAVATKLQNDELYRVMLFCAPDTGLNQYSASDIAFPHQIELKVNLDDVKANLRGLKNTPGSTRPADITSFLRKKPGYNNQVTLTYALTQKVSAYQKYFLVVNLVRKMPVQALVQRLQAGKSISKEQVLREMRSKAQDPDIVATSTIMSLKCPLSMLRIEVPCRSVSCKHNQCFDASSYLQLQEQAPTWTCPVCAKNVTFESLLVDQYVDDILRSTSRNIEQVTIEPEGQWTRNALPETPAPSHESGSAGDKDEEDFVEVQYRRLSSTRQEVNPVQATPPNNSATLTRASPLSSREESVVSSAHKTKKRPARAVIDLTLSDDDDTEQQPRSKIARTSFQGEDNTSSSPWNTQVQFSLPGRSPSSTPTVVFDSNHYSSPFM